MPFLCIRFTKSDTRSKDVVTDTIELPLGITISSEICRDLSIITGVYAEPTENGKVETPAIVQFLLLI